VTDSKGCANTPASVLLPLPLPRWQMPEMMNIMCRTNNNSKCNSGTTYSWIPSGSLATRIFQSNCITSVTTPYTVTVTANGAQQLVSNRNCNPIPTGTATVVSNISVKEQALLLRLLLSCFTPAAANAYHL